MPPKVYQHKMTRAESRLWKQEEMEGWRKAYVACAEHDARDEGYKRFEIIGTNGDKLVAEKVCKLPEKVKNTGGF
jgi:hypothetical protein